jgi:hypothetical protein
VNAEEGFTGLAEWGEVFGRHVERPRRVGLTLGDVDASEPRSVHSLERDEVVSFVYDRDVHRNADCFCCSTSILDDVERRIQSDTFFRVG